jgi:hypothetical protein
MIFFLLLSQVINILNSADVICGFIIETAFI